MKLSVRKTLEYFSPTSLMQAFECELEFYLNRLSGLEITRLPQNEAMAIGCAFDAFVKSRVAELIDKPVKLAKLLETVEEQNLHCIPIGHDLFDKYEQWGFVDRLLNEGIEDIELEYLSKLGGSEVPGSSIKLGEVILFGKPDAELKSGVPLDWKTSGWQSKSLRSPAPGYTLLYTDGYNRGSANDFRTMDVIDQRWATQLTIYHWLKHGLVLEDIRCAIDQILFFGTRMHIVSYRTHVPSGFVNKLWTTIKHLWDKLKEGIVEEPIPSKQLCTPYNSPKPCSLFCPLYKNFSENKVHQFILGSK